MRDRLFYALLLGACPVQALAAVWIQDEFTLGALLGCVAATLFLLVGCAAYAVAGGHHPAWGLLGGLNVLGMMVLIFAASEAGNDDSESRGFEIIPLAKRASHLATPMDEANESRQ